MKAPQLLHPITIKRKLIGEDVPYSESGQISGKKAYYVFLKQTIESYTNLFNGTHNGRAILEEIVLLKNLIDFGDSHADSLTKVFLRIEAIKSKIEEYIKERTTDTPKEVALAIELEIVGGFPGAKTDSEIPFLASPPKKLYQRLSKIKTIDELVEVWSNFKRDICSPLNADQVNRFKLAPNSHRQIILQEKIDEIDALIERTVGTTRGLEALVATISSVPELIDKDDAIMHQKDDQEKSVASIRTAVELYCWYDLQEHEDIKPTYLANNNITLQLGYTTSLGKRIERTIIIVAPHNEDLIDNRTTFNQVGFSRFTILQIFVDLKAAEVQEQVVVDTDKPHTELDTSTALAIASTKVVPKKSSFFQKLQSSWRWFSNQFSFARLRRSPAFMMGFALFLGLAHSGKDHNKIITSNNAAPITTVAVPVTHTVQEQPTTVDTPAPVVTNTIANQIRVTRASTSDGSRYSLASHNHNTDETLQRMVKDMGFNSVQTRVIATRLDHQLRAARDIQAPGTHTQAHQDVVMEELNGQIRLSVQNANGRTLYRTGWFDRELGFRNFQPRRQA